MDTQVIDYCLLQNVQRQMEELNIKNEPAQVTPSTAQKQDILQPTPTAPVTQSTLDRSEIIQPKPAPIDIPNGSPGAASSTSQRVRNTKKMHII